MLKVRAMYLGEQPVELAHFNGQPIAEAFVSVPVAVDETAQEPNE